MNLKNRIFSLIEVIVESLKFNGISMTLLVLYHYARTRFFVNTCRNPYEFLGFKLKYLDRNYLYYIFFEQFGLNSYYFRSKTNNPVIIDIGANIGDTMIYFKWLYPRSIIFAFEPHPLAFDCLKANIKNNKFHHVYAYDSALGNTKGLVDLFNSEMTAASTASIKISYKEQNYKKTASLSKVKIDKLSNFKEINKLEKVDLLKMDIEGAEGELFKSLDFILPKTKKIIIEYHLLPEIKENSFDQIIAKLNSYNFKVSVKGFYRNDLNQARSISLIIADK